MLALTPLASLLATGGTLTEHDDMPRGGALLGQPVWSPIQLLADLELRLGLPSADLADAVRAQHWSRALGQLLTTSDRFYAESYRVDPLGTATTLLRMRDELVAAGWNGDPIADGGERLDTFAELEAVASAPPGMPDRLRRVEDSLRQARLRRMHELRLAEPAGIWPARWRRVFDLLTGLGVTVRTVEPALPKPGDSDLAQVQRLLQGHPPQPARPLKGDGSLLVVRAETPGELAAAIAALLRRWGQSSAAIIRGGDGRVLDDALVAQGLPSIGVVSGSTWRPAPQVLPLAIELAFEPRDPYRVLELLTLPTGPFEGMVGRELARAVASAPGIGGAPWQEAKETITEYADKDAAAKQLERVAEWLETPGHVGRAPRTDLVLVALRVRNWLQARLAFERKRGERPSRIATLPARSTSSTGVSSACRRRGPSGGSTEQCSPPQNSTARAASRPL